MKTMVAIGLIAVTCGLVGGIECGTVSLLAGTFAAAACLVVAFIMTKEKAAPEKEAPKPQKR